METKQWNYIAKLEECKVFVDSTGAKGANLQDKFSFQVFAAVTIILITTIKLFIFITV